MTAPTDAAARLRRIAGFLASGTIAFLVDVGVTTGLETLTQGHPAACRVAGVAAAMVVAWISHRRLTFAVSTPPSLTEFARYVALASGAAAINYVAFVTIIWVNPSLPRAVAIAISSALAMGASYVGMRFGVFTQRT